MTVWADSHCHLPFERLEDPDAELVAARAAGVEVLVTVGTDLDQSRAAVDFARRHDGVWATVGLHPHDAANGLDPVLALLDECLAAGDGKVVAVGECGLDFHYDHSPREVQREVFAAQVAAATERDLALVIHTREAWDETFAILDDVGPPARTVFHCFTGGPDEARAALDRGAHLSFSGIVTFRNADDVRAAAELCPLDRLLVETDAPFLAPVPHRGSANRPTFLPDVGAGVAAAKGIPIEDVAAASLAATRTVFRLD